MRTRDQRVTCALKWHYLDGLGPAEIRDRFEEDHDVELTQSTIRDYLSEAPREEIVEQIENEHANTRLQIAEREQAMLERAREAERNATTDEPVMAMVPQMMTVKDNEGTLRVADWERVPPGDDRRPEWASERDVIVVFVDDTKFLDPGQEYPAGARRGGYPARPGTFPEFRQARVGIERDVTDPKQAAMARQEQSQHLQAKGEALGIYSVDVNLNAEVESEHSVSLDEETAAAIRSADLSRGADDE